VAKTALINKANAKPKFKVRGYTRCTRCGRVRPLPYLSSGDGPPRRAPGCHEEQLVTRINDCIAGRPSQVETPVRKGGEAQ